MIIENFYQSLMNHVSDGVYIVDNERLITYWNEAAALMTGFSQEEVLGKSSADVLMHVDGEGTLLCIDNCHLLETMNTGNSVNRELFLHHKQGYRFSVISNTYVVQNQSGKVIGCAEIFRENRDTTSMVELLANYEERIFIDEETGMANRRYIKEQIDVRFDEFRRFSWNFGLVLIDFANYERIRDRFGSEACDNALKIVSRTLAVNARNHDLIGYWGNGSFLCIIVNVDYEGLSVAAQRYSRVLGGLKDPVAEEIAYKIFIGATLVQENDMPVSLIDRVSELTSQLKNSGIDKLVVN